MSFFQEIDQAIDNAIEFGGKIYEQQLQEVEKEDKDRVCTTSKKCPRCKKIKFFDCYFGYPLTRFGSYCKTCNKEINREKYLNTRYQKPKANKRYPRKIFEVDDTLFFKTCGSCKKRLSISSFSKSKYIEGGYRSSCKDCDQVYKALYRLDRNKIKPVQKKQEKRFSPDLNKKEKVCACCKKNKPIALFGLHSFLSDGYRSNCKECESVRKSTFRKTHPLTNFQKLIKNLRSRQRKALKGILSEGSTLKYLGCTREEVWLHIKKTFKPGMEDAGQGVNGWHVDHIRPLASFDFNDPSQIKEAFHYTNLQALWWHENCQKGAKWEGKKFKYKKEEPS